jgi:predicted Zn-dependent peptidase
MRQRKTPGSKVPIYERRLANNVMLISETVRETETAVIGFWFPCGSRDENKGFYGAAHFVEHMLFKGTPQFTAFDIARAFDRVGGFVNAFTERELSCIYCVVPAAHSSAAAEILCDMTANSLFSDTDIERERAVIESEILSSLDDPEEAAFDAVCEILWPGHPVSRPISGTVREIKALTRDSLLLWYRKQIAAGPLLVTAAGKFDLPGLERALEQLPGRPLSAEAPGGGMPEFTPGAFFRPADFQQSQIFMFYPLLFTPGEEQYYEWSVFNAIAGDTMSSRLFQRLREQSGYCYTVYSFFQLLRDTGVWGASAASSRKSIRRVLAEMREELDALFDRGVTETEIDDAREHLCGEELIGSEDMENRMKRLARQYLAGQKLHTVEEAVERIRRVTGEGLASCIASSIDRSREAVILYGPPVKKWNVPESGESFNTSR